MPQSISYLQLLKQIFEVRAVIITVNIFYYRAIV